MSQNDTRGQTPSGFTLVELILAVAITTFLAGTIHFLLDAAATTFEAASEQLALHKAGSDLVFAIIDGGFESKGVQGARELWQAGERSATLVPLWTDDTIRPNPELNKEQKFTLNRQFKPGESIPIGQIRSPGKIDWETANIKFFYGEKRSLAELDDAVQFIDPIPLLAEARVLFTPDPEADSKILKTFHWDPQSKRVFETYQGATRDLLANDPLTIVEHFSFAYFDNLNQRLLPEKDGYLTKQKRSRVTGVKLYFVLNRKSSFREVSSYTNVRNKAGVGVSLEEGTTLPIANSTKVKGFAVGNFQGLHGEDKISIQISHLTEKTVAWNVTLTLKQRQGATYLTHYEMQSPVGKTLVAEPMERLLVAGEYVDLLNLDRSGLYDYDDEPDVKDFVSIGGDYALLEVVQMDTDGANLVLRP